MVREQDTPLDFREKAGLIANRRRLARDNKQHDALEILPDEPSRPWTESELRAWEEAVGRRSKEERPLSIVKNSPISLENYRRNKKP